jgi:RNA polymerase sigma-70 factor (ECF subfamily)
MAEAHEITELLQAWSGGVQGALTELVPRVQRELQRLARYYMSGERADHPLQTTALINEAYIRLIGWKKPDWRNRAHFFAICAQLMRRILVDAARGKNAAARKKGARETTFDEAFTFSPDRSRDLLRLDAALTALGEIDVRKSRIVELRFFGGLSEDEAAAVLQISSRTVQREWNLARTWLYGEIRSGL